jgi:hypothetical protein
MRFENQDDYLAAGLAPPAPAAFFRNYPALSRLAHWRCEMQARRTAALANILWKGIATGEES